ncbi:unnamed protein product [Laminaria digitata]
MRPPARRPTLKCCGVFCVFFSYSIMCVLKYIFVLFLCCACYRECWVHPCSLGACASLVWVTCCVNFSFCRRRTRGRGGGQVKENPHRAYVAGCAHWVRHQTEMTSLLFVYKVCLMKTGAESAV